MRFIAACRQCSSIFELLLDVVGELEEEEQKRQLLEDFEDNDRGDFGQKPGDTQYRRKMKKTPDMFDSRCESELRVKSEE